MSSNSEPSCLTLSHGESRLALHPYRAVRMNEAFPWSEAVALIEAGFKAAAKELPIREVDLRVFRSELVIPEFGFQAFTENYDAVALGLSYDERNFDLTRTHLSATIAHELHHAARNQKIPYGPTLGERLVWEGLGVAFQKQTFPDTPLPINSSLNEERLDAYAAAALEQWDTQDYNHEEWFFGATGGWPRWVGYTLGYRIAREWLRQNKKTASEAVWTPAQELKPKA